MVEIDMTGIATFVPVFAFLLVFTVTYALLSKTKALGENRFVSILISFAVAIIFLVSSTAIEYVRTITPWFAVFVIALVFIVLLVGVILKVENLEKVFTPALGWFILVVVLIFFFISGIQIFGNAFASIQFLNQPQFLGVIILCVIAVAASWLLTRKIKEA